MNIKIEKLNGDYSVKINQKVKINLLDFAEMIGADIYVRERNHNIYHIDKSKKYYVHFKNCTIKKGDGLITINGDGNTINQALNDYAKKISGKLLVFDADAGCMRHNVIAHKIIYRPSNKIKKMFTEYSNA